MYKYAKLWSYALCSVPMAQRVTPDVLVLVLPIVLLVLLTPFSWSSDGLGPGCHLYREHTHTHFFSHTSLLRVKETQ